MQRKAGQRRAHLKEVRPRPEACVHLEHDRFAQWIDGRIGDLGKSLAEVGVYRTRRAGQGRNGGVVAHGPHGILAFGGHGREDHAHVFAGESEAALQASSVPPTPSGSSNSAESSRGTSSWQ